jgi:hypothetical protein
MVVVVVVEGEGDARIIKVLISLSYQGSTATDLDSDATHGGDVSTLFHLRLLAHTLTISTIMATTIDHRMR